MSSRAARRLVAALLRLLCLVIAGQVLLRGWAMHRAIHDFNADGGGPISIGILWGIVAAQVALTAAVWLYADVVTRWLIDAPSFDASPEPTRWSSIALVIVGLLWLHAGFAWSLGFLAFPLVLYAAGPDESVALGSAEFAVPLSALLAGAALACFAQRLSGRLFGRSPAAASRPTSAGAES